MFCMFRWYSPSSDTSWQRITFPEYTILQFFLHNYSVNKKHFKQVTVICAHFES